MVNFLNRLISWSFYALFFLVPIIFTQDTSELFEFNKIWLTFAFTVIIVATLLVKMIFQGRIRIQRTPLDIPIVLFLISQLISTFISLDTHTSFWGYYSRFNGGFLSILTYVILYYAFVTFATDTNINSGVAEVKGSRQGGLNEAKEHLRDERLTGPLALWNNISEFAAKNFVYRCLLIILASGTFVALWGLPSHFGYDPTCLVFRGTFDVSCWTFSFQPKVRIFSTLGQPDWLSAYLAVLIPLAMGLGFYFCKQSKKLMASGYLLVAILFYLDFLYAKSRGGFVGLSVSLILFFTWLFWQEKKQLCKVLSKPKKILLNYWYILVLIGSIGIITFIVGTSFDQIDKFTLPAIITKLQTHTQSSPKQTVSHSQPTTFSTGELGGTDSGKIRLFVWQGAIQAWLHYPIFGTGVETFAYAYYLFMPPGHNMTSEFGYLYNKAHNEYLNFLATTGIVGLGTYLFMVGTFLYFCIKKLMLDARNLNLENETRSQKLEKSSFKSQASTNQLPSSNIQLLSVGLLASYLGILVTNFFGFSVVIINLFLFIIPAFVFLLQDQLDEEKAIAYPKIINSKSSIVKHQSSTQWIFSSIVGIIAIYFFYILILYWNADRAFALGQHLVDAQDFQNAYQPLHQAVQMRPGEPVFQDELSLDDAVLAVAMVQQNKKVTDTATQLAKEAVATSNDLITNHPNIVTFWKTRVRVMYTLAQLNPQYMQDALTAIQKAAQLAPTDAKISYNLGLVLGQTGHIKEAINVLQNTIKLKKDYRDAYYALGIFYHSLGVNKTGQITNADYAQKAIDEMHFILNNFGTDQQATDALKAWGAE